MRHKNKREKQSHGQSLLEAHDAPRPAPNETQVSILGQLLPKFVGPHSFLMPVPSDKFAPLHAWSLHAHRPRAGTPTLLDPRPLACPPLCSFAFLQLRPRAGPPSRVRPRPVSRSFRSALLQAAQSCDVSSLR